MLPPFSYGYKKLCLRALYDFVQEKRSRSGRLDAENFFVQRNTNAILAIAHAERNLHVDFIVHVVFFHQLLKRHDDVIRAFQVARGAHAYSQLNHGALPYRAADNAHAADRAPFRAERRYKGSS